MDSRRESRMRGRGVGGAIAPHIGKFQMMDRRQGPTCLRSSMRPFGVFPLRQTAVSSRLEISNGPRKPIGNLQAVFHPRFFGYWKSPSRGLEIFCLKCQISRESLIAAVNGQCVSRGGAQAFEKIQLRHRPSWNFPKTLGVLVVPRSIVVFDV